MAIMFIPYSTDAPIYHWPFATVGLIVVNTVVFAGMVVMEPSFEAIAPWTPGATGCLSASVGPSILGPCNSEYGSQNAY